MSSQIKKKFIQGSIFTDITDEINNAVSVEQARAEAAEQENADAISDEQTRAEAAEQANADAISAEQTRATAAEQANADDIATERGRIDAILEASTADKDSFAEVVSLINSVDTENDQAFAGHVSNYNNYVSSNDAAIAALQADVDQNEADADAAILALQTDLANLSGDGGFATDAELAAAVAAEETRALTAEQANADAISAEVTRATAAEDVLQGNIDVEKGRIDAILEASTADKDSFKEIVDLINSVDTENDNAFASYVLSNDAAIAALQADVDQNELDGDNDRAAIRTELADAVAAEATLREDADDALSSRVDALEAVSFEKESFVLSATDISNGYIDLANEAIAKSVNFCVGRLAGFEDEDYSLNVVDGVTRITFTGSFASGLVSLPDTTERDRDFLSATTFDTGESHNGNYTLTASEGVRWSGTGLGTSVGVTIDGMALSGVTLIPGEDYVFRAYWTVLGRDGEGLFQTRVLEGSKSINNNQTASFINGSKIIELPFTAHESVNSFSVNLVNAGAGTEIEFTRYEIIKVGGESIVPVGEEALEEGDKVNVAYSYSSL